MGVDDSDNLFDDLDDLSRLGSVPQVTAANHSPLHGSISYPQPGQQDLDMLDNNEGSGNSTKRKAQNRAAQRAFRERKERHLKDLQAKTQELEQATTLMNEENSRLKAKLQALEMENNALKGQNITFSFPVRPSNFHFWSLGTKLLVAHSPAGRHSQSTAIGPRLLLRPGKTRHHG